MRARAPLHRRSNLLARMKVSKHARMMIVLVARACYRRARSVPRETGHTHSLAKDAMKIRSREGRKALVDSSPLSSPHRERERAHLLYAPERDPSHHHFFDLKKVDLKTPSSVLLTSSWLAVQTFPWQRRLASPAPPCRKIAVLSRCRRKSASRASRRRRRCPCAW